MADKVLAEGQEAPPESVAPNIGPPRKETQILVMLGVLLNALNFSRRKS